MEVYYNGEWGTVCDDGWDLNDAQVVCIQLGFGAAIAARDNAFYGQSSGQIWLDEINCTGTELTIEDCSHNGWGIQDCSHGKDAGVQCAILNGNFSLNYVNKFMTILMCPKFDEQTTSYQVKLKKGLYVRI